MPENCTKLGCPEFIFLARQDDCTGEPIPGNNGFVLRCTRNAVLEKQLRDEEISEFVADCGQPDRYRQPPQIETFSLTFETSTLSPDLEAALTGETLITNGGNNAGVAYMANQGCSTSTSKPKYIAEVYFKRRGACGTDGTQYVRYILMGVEFAPSELDTEGQIRYIRYSGQSEPLPASGLVALNDGPFDNLPAGIVTSIEGLGDDAVHALFVADPTEDPLENVDLVEGTCYTAVVPAGA